MRMHFDYGPLVDEALQHDYTEGRITKPSYMGDILFAGCCFLVMALLIAVALFGE